MRRLALAGAALSLLSCHLADDPDAPACPAGTHVLNGQCVADALSAAIVTIAPPAGGTSCVGDPAAQRPPSLTPETITIKVSGEFRFKNDDVTEHEIRGADNQVWATVKPGALSTYFGITKVGSWAYRVSGCAKGGTVVVE